MEFLHFLLIFSFIWKLSTSIRCYTCLPNRTFQNQYEALCQHFNYSEAFQIECKFSTMCFKKVTVLDLDNGLQSVSIHRGCALQTMEGEQEKINKTWHPVKNIHEVYAEGCAEDPNNNDRATKTTHCYCRGDLCNSSNRLRLNSYTLLSLPVLLVIFSRNTSIFS